MITMKPEKSYTMLILLLLALFILTDSKGEEEYKHRTGKSEECSEWKKSGSTSIDMKWCKNDRDEINYQFYNRYTFDVHFWYKFDCTDGRTYDGNIFLNSGEASDKADMMKSKPSTWVITRKEKKDSNGKWVTF